jgi:hypothetical protein
MVLLALAGTSFSFSFLGAFGASIVGCIAFQHFVHSISVECEVSAVASGIVYLTNV